MLIVRGAGGMRPDRRAEMLRLAHEMELASSNDEGCLLYAFLIDTEDPNRLVNIEVWESQDALDRHMEHSHTIDFMAAIPDLAADDYSMTVRDTER